MRTRSHLVLLAAAAGLLAGCGPVYLGSAAVVGEERISMTEADEVSEGYCTLSAATATAQGQSAIPGADVRRQALSLLIVESVAEQVADREGLPIRTPELNQQELQQARELFGDSTDLVVATISRNEKALSIAVELARQELGAAAEQMSEQELAQAGQQVLLKRAESFEIHIDPRFGMAGVGEIVAPTGSLSVPGPPLPGQEIPDALNCRA